MIADFEKVLKLHKDFEKALNLLEDFVEFVEIKEVQKVIDGSFDPELSVSMAKHLLDVYRMGWREHEYAEPA